MNKDELNELLDSIYELEGLVHLVINRDDSPEHLKNLIRRKGHIVADMVDIVCVESDTEVISEPEVPAPVVAPVAAVVEAVTPIEEPVIPEVEPVAPIAVAVSAGEESADELLYEAAEEIAENTFEEAATEAAQTPTEAEQTPTEAEQTPAAGPVATVVIPDVEPKRIVAEPRGRLVFSINDRYRFKRELFNNSDAEFNNTLALVASMENYDEAEEYFIDELGWNEQTAEVADFLEILKKYFKE